MAVHGLTENHERGLLASSDSARFIGEASRLHGDLHAWIDVQAASGPLRRKDALGMHIHEARHRSGAA